MNTIPQITTQEVVRCLPQAAIDYLWQLVGQRPDAPAHTFLLARQTLAGREIQDILHIAETLAPNETHKVYGFAAVNAAIRVEHRDGAWAMALYGPLEAAGMAGSMTAERAG